MVLFASTALLWGGGTGEAEGTATTGVKTAPAMGQKVYPTPSAYEQATGRKIGAYGEAPMLAELVRVGQLPPVEQRLPREPVVLQPLQEIGTYGGTLRSVALGPTMQGHDVEMARVQNLFTLAPDFAVVPNIAKGWDISGDYKTLTVTLREGMKWSDGVDFTADDVLFWYEDIARNEDLSPVMPRDWSPGDEPMKLTKVDDYTVRFEFAVPYPVAIEMLAVGVGGKPYAPRHFLAQYHKNYNPEAAKIAKDEGYEEWYQCFQFHALITQGQQDPARPTLHTWALEKIDTMGNKHFVRNPYFWKIDTAGNQLPYADRQARILVENAEVANLKTLAGEFDYSGVLLTLEKYTLYKENEAKGDYRTNLWQTAYGAHLSLGFNLNHKDPVLREVFSDLRFRQAMSLAINREEINAVCFFGKGVPRQLTTHPDTTFFEPWMESHFAEYDPERANQMLDEIGLKWDAGHEVRLLPDGRPLSITMEYAVVTGPMTKMCQLVSEYWAAVGVKALPKEESRELFQQRGRAGDRDMSTWCLNRVTEFAMRNSRCVRFRPPFSAAVNPLGGLQWWNWYNSGGKAGEEPPQEVKRLFDLAEEFQTTLAGTDDYMRIGREILKMNVENLYLIGTVGLAPQPVIVKNNLRNFPETGVFDWDYRFYVPYLAETWFFED
jgi:peptide/nickel transport system substrate-binding protein